MNVVSYGGGTNSTAMIIGMHQRGIPIDLILFADTGAERPETYAYVQMFDGWLRDHGMPGVTRVHYTDQKGNRQTLEDECLHRKNLPSIAYGPKKCSEKYKIRPQEKYCKQHPRCRVVWASGQKVTKWVGYDAGEYQRRENAIVYDIQDKLYDRRYPLIDDWDWDREKCQKVIAEASLPLPGKSSCFFCPSMKKAEIRQLRNEHPELFARAVAIEENAAENCYSVKGLGRDWSWKDYVAASEAQGAWCELFKDMPDAPCGCYDG